MARILAISSQVVYGSVGLSVMVPALQALGHDVLAMPTVLLSNHPGHQHVAVVRIPAETLTAMVDALAANGWLTGVDAVLSGYLPTAAHVAVVASTVQRLRAVRPGLPFVCDPVIGDWPKGIYIDTEAAAAIRARLLPLATVLTPNAFELGWLTGCAVTDVLSAERAIRWLPDHVMTVATSVPASGPSAMLTNLAVHAQRRLQVDVARRAGVPHGTGDLLAALICGYAFRQDRVVSDTAPAIIAPAIVDAFWAAVPPAVATVEQAILGAARDRLHPLPGFY
jgi:pyridoxine kinase